MSSLGYVLKLVSRRSRMGLTPSLPKYPPPLFLDLETTWDDLKALTESREAMKTIIIFGSTCLLPTVPRYLNDSKEWRYLCTCNAFR